MEDLSHVIVLHYGYYSSLLVMVRHGAREWDPGGGERMVPWWGLENGTLVGAREWYPGEGERMGPWWGREDGTLVAAKS